MFHSSSNALRHHPRQWRHLIRAAIGFRINNIYILNPTAVVKLLQYSGIGSNSGMGFLRTNDSQLIEIGEFQFGF